MSEDKKEVSESIMKLRQSKTKVYTRSEDTPLSPKELDFCHEYLKTGKYSDAALAMGTKSKTPAVIGHLMAQRPNVAAYIKKLKQERAEKAKVDGYYVLEGLKEVAARCLQRIPVLVWDGEAWVESGEWKFDSAGANKAFELIGKHIGFFDQDNNQKRALIQINIDRDDEGL